MADEKIDLIGIVSIGQIKAVRQLIDLQKAGKIELDINERDEDGNFAAIVAAQRNDFPMLELLVNNGAKIDLPDGYNNTVEKWAKEYRNEKMLHLIKQVSKNSSPHEPHSELPQRNDKHHVSPTPIKVGGPK